MDTGKGVIIAAPTTVANKAAKDDGDAGVDKSSSKVTAKSKLSAMEASLILSIIEHCSDSTIKADYNLAAVDVGYKDAKEVEDAISHIKKVLGSAALNIINTASKSSEKKQELGDDEEEIESTSTKKRSRTIKDGSDDEGRTPTKKRSRTVKVNKVNPINSYFRPMKKERDKDDGDAMDNGSEEHNTTVPADSEADE